MTASLELSIIIPAYNEEVRLPQTLIKIEKFFQKNTFECEIIVIDDGSRDLTSQEVRDFSKVSKKKIILLQHEQNQGKGAAIKTGVMRASGEYILIYDADGATPIEELLRIWDQRSTDQIIIGSRALASDETNLQARFYRIGLGRIYSFFVSLLVIDNIKDTQCGFKLIPLKIAKYIFSITTMLRYSFDVEMLYIAKNMSVQILERPVNWTHISGSKVNVIIDGLTMLFDLLKIRFRHRNLTPKSFDKL